MPTSGETLNIVAAYLRNDYTWRLEDAIVQSWVFRVEARPIAEERRPKGKAGKDGDSMRRFLQPHPSTRINDESEIGSGKMNFEREYNEPPSLNDGNDGGRFR